MRGIAFTFDSVQLMYYIYWFSWLDKKKKRATTNPKKTDNKGFQYKATVALIYEEIESHPERVQILNHF